MTDYFRPLGPMKAVKSMFDSNRRKALTLALNAICGLQCQSGIDSGHPVTEVDKKREATASIRGYFYQLDAALLDILSAGLDDKIVIEGIEDFDRYTDEGVVYSQVKYYAEQTLTDSVLRDMPRLWPFIQTRFGWPSMILLTSKQRANRSALAHF
ncbi:hypothetical protein [Sinorhizobium fredii]|nr:hypothetical protein [Sinorhizobium fredii]